MNKNAKTSWEKYNILKEENGISLQLCDAPIPEGFEVIFTFEAADFNQAMAIRNQFLGFEPYVPFAEHLAATRQLTLFDEHKKAITEVNVLIYQPVKAGENEWHCEYHINIDYKGKKPKTVNLGGRNVIGFDSVQALQSAFLVIDSAIQAHNDGKKEKIYWLEYGNDCGFIKK
jgi:hypothetical protein